MYFLVNLTQSI